MPPTVSDFPRLLTPGANPSRLFYGEVWVIPGSRPPHERRLRGRLALTTIFAGEGERQ